MAPKDKREGVVQYIFAIVCSIMSLYVNLYEEGNSGPMDSIVLEYDLCK